MSLSVIESHPLTVSEVAAEAEVAPSAVRFYERYGLVVAARTAGNQRRFAADAPCRIRVAKVAQRVGLTVREIADILEPIGPDSGPADWGEVNRTLVAEAEARLAQLRRTLDDLGSGTKLCEIE